MLGYKYQYRTVVTFPTRVAPCTTPLTAKFAFPPRVIIQKTFFRQWPYRAVFSRPFYPFPVVVKTHLDRYNTMFPPHTTVLAGPMFVPLTVALSLLRAGPTLTAGLLPVVCLTCAIAFRQDSWVFSTRDRAQRNVWITALVDAIKQTGHTATSDGADVVSDEISAVEAGNVSADFVVLLLFSLPSDNVQHELQFNVDYLQTFP